MQLNAKLICHIHSSKHLWALLLPPETKMVFTQTHMIEENIYTYSLIAWTDC
jgi:hypothetical protein